MALSSDQTAAMNALAARNVAGVLINVKDLEMVSKLLVDAWALSAADAKSFRNGVHPSHNSFGATV